MKKFLLKNKVLKNASWIVGCKVVQSILSFFIGIFTARYLGPANYGTINYAASLVAFAMPLMQLGLNETLIQEFINKPKQNGEVLGTALVMNVSSGILSVIGLLAFSIVANAGDKETIVVCLLYSLTLIFQATEVTKYWFQSKLLSKYTSITSLAAHFIVAIYKIYLLVFGKSIVWFAITHVIEAIIISIVLLILYKKYSNQKLSFSLSLVKEMFSRSKHYISSGLMIVIFQQTDKIMLKFMMSEMEVGYYSSSISCMAITGFVYGAIIDSARPWVLSGKKMEESVFVDRLKVLFSIVIGISLSQSVVMSIFAKPIVLLLFGQDYMPAASVLRIAVWYVTFGNLGTIRNIWILANNKQKYLPIINLSGAVLNVIANYLLIPVYGAMGAAVASFITQFFSNFILCFLIKPIRETGFIILESLNPNKVINLINRVKEK